MEAADVLDISRDAIVVLLKIGAPVMLVALIVGVAISLLQALTQIQETTLSFVPKIIVMMAALVLFLPFMLVTLQGFTERIVDRIVHVG
jgi:flagellar biosynthetic protein FliQ